MIYFFSDVHLGLFNRENNISRENKLLQFFSLIEKDCETLFIVGDLFDYWFEYSTVIPKYFYRTLFALKELRLKGIKIEYIMGNHDFGHKTFFEQELDIPILKHDVIREFNGKKFYISHGDGKNNKDIGYKMLKVVLRNRFSQWLFGWIHPDLGIKLAMSSSKTSRQYTGKKDWGENDGMEDFAIKQIDSGIDFVVVGHRHKATFKKLGSGIFVDLGDWLNPKPTFAYFDGIEMKLEFVDDFIRQRNG